MQSILKSLVRGLKASVRSLTVTAIAGLSLFVLASSAQALTISVGTGTVVNIPSAVRSYKAGVLPTGDQSFYVIYATADSTSYSIMFASQTRGATSGGGAPGWAISTIFSTNTNASNSNIAAVMDGIVYGSGQILIYYYDAALGSLRCLTGPSLPYAPVTVATATVANIQVLSDDNVNNATVIYSSQAANGRYEIRLASRTIGNAAVAIAGTGVNGAITISTSADENASGSFYAVKTADVARLRVYYYDSLAGALREVQLDGSNIPNNSSRGTMDTGVIANIFASDSGSASNGVTRLVYTVGGATVRYAVQRRAITGQAWYVQKVDDGTAAQYVAMNGNNPTISYLKGGNLWAARGVLGTFFDDFAEGIDNKQLGIGAIVSNVTAGALYQFPSGANADRGVFLPSAGTGIGTFNWTSLLGTVKNSFGTAVRSVAISDTITGSATVVGTNGSAFPGTQTLSPASSSNRAGGLTDASGSYTINVASGSINAVSASSTSWFFEYDVDKKQVSVSTIVALGAGASGTTGSLQASFIAYSSPTIDIFNIDGASQRTSTFSVSYVDNTGYAYSFVAESQNNNGGPLSSAFTNLSMFRLVPQTAQGTAPSITNSTQPVESGSIEFHNVGGSATSVTLTTTTLWNRYPSTSTLALGASNPDLPKWYTLVVASQTASGHWSVGKLVDAVRLMPVEINFTSVTAGAVNTLPGLSLITSTGLINTSSDTTIVIQSNYSNIFSNPLVQNNVYLTTSNVAQSGLILATDIPTRHVSVSPNGSTVTLHATILGLDTNQTWYVRISSKPSGDVLFTHPQVVFSQPITFSSAAITSVATNDIGDNTVAFATTSVKFKINGRGFTTPGISTVTFSTSTEINPETAFPKWPAGNVTSFSIISSTAMLVDYQFDIRAATVGMRYHVYAGTYTSGVLSTPGRYNSNSHHITVSSIVLNSTMLNTAGVLVMSTPAITSITPAIITNTRTFTLTIRGRGLQPGSTIQFFATDGSVNSQVASTILENRTDIGGLNASSTTLTCTVDLRHPVAPGKSFYAYMTYIDTTSPYFESSSNTIRINSAGSGVFLTVSSLTLTGVNYPKLNGQNATQIFNSTPSVTVGLMGLGLVSGTTVNIATLMSGTFQSSIPVVAGTVETSSGAFAAFTSTAFFQAPTGNYALTISTLIGQFGSATRFSADASTTIDVLAASLTGLSALSHQTAYSTLKFASYTVTGVGLLPNVTFYLDPPTGAGDRIGVVSRSTNAANFSSLTLGFDLRAATTAVTYTLRGQANYGAVQSTQVLIPSGSGTIAISTVPILGAVPVTARSNAGIVTVDLSGAGLAHGASIQMIHNGTLAQAGTTDYIGNVQSDVNTRIGTMTILNSLQTTGQVSINIANAATSSLWVLRMALAMPETVIGGAVPQAKDDAGSGQPTRAATVGNGIIYQSTYTPFTVTESSAPGVPTGLTVLSAGSASVTLRWISPSDDGNSNVINGASAVPTPLTTGSQFIVYYSSGNGDRGFGGASFYPVAANGVQGALEQSATNFTFANTWAHYLPGAYANSRRSTDPVSFPSFYESFSTASVRGLLVSTQTLAISAVTVKTSTDATGTTGATSIPAGRVIEATLTINPGTSAGDYWFIVRAQDEVGNLSPTDVVYSTAYARIGAGNVTVTDTIDPNATTTLTSTDLGGGVASGGTIPPGALEGSDTLSRVADTNPPAATAGTTLVGPAVDVTLGSGKTEFKKPITLSFTLSGSALATVQAVRAALVKVSFFNGSRWVLIRESSFDGTNVTCSVTHLTKFAVAIAAPAANLTGATVYPNPFRPSIASHAGQNITFDSLPANSTVKIYTLAGDLVKQLDDADGDGIISWNAKNEDGQDAASGVYFALLKGGGDTKTLKVAVQR